MLKHPTSLLVSMAFYRITVCAKYLIASSIILQDTIVIAHSPTVAPAKLRTAIATNVIYVQRPWVRETTLDADRPVFLQNLLP